MKRLKKWIEVRRNWRRYLAHKLEELEKDQTEMSFMIHRHQQQIDRQKLQILIQEKKLQDLEASVLLIAKA